MLDAQQIAEIREMKEEWVIPPHVPSRSALNCDEEILEWLGSADAAPQFIVFVGKHRGAPAQDVQSAAKVDLRHRFLDLAQQWSDETGHLSSPSQKMLHPSYQAIMGMAQEHKDEVIDLFIQDMRENRRQWFWALSYLTQANPITPEDAGRIDRMIGAWVRWGELRARR